MYNAKSLKIALLLQIISLGGIHSNNREAYWESKMDRQMDLRTIRRNEKKMERESWKTSDFSKLCERKPNKDRRKMWNNSPKDYIILSSLEIMLDQDKIPELNQ